MTLNVNIAMSIYNGTLNSFNLVWIRYIHVFDSINCWFCFVVSLQNLLTHFLLLKKTGEYLATFLFWNINSPEVFTPAAILNLKIYKFFPWSYFLNFIGSPHYNWKKIPRNQILKTFFQVPFCPWTSENWDFYVENSAIMLLTKVLTWKSSILCKLCVPPNKNSNFPQHFLIFEIILSILNDAP